MIVAVFGAALVAVGLWRARRARVYEIAGHDLVRLFKEAEVRDGR